MRETKAVNTFRKAAHLECARRVCVRANSCFNEKNNYTMMKKRHPN